jgi:hypothetical protein
MSVQLVTGATSATASTNTAVTPIELAKALAADPSVVAGASYLTAPPQGTPNAVMTTPLAGFPTAGSSYALLTTGDANLAAQAGSGNTGGVDDGGSSFRGDTDFDVTVLKVDLNVPATANCLLGFDFRFLSQEYPHYVGSQYNDAFVAELDKSTWTTKGSTISAPNNFAFDPKGNPITINAAGVTSMTAAEAAGTVYGGATPKLSAATPISPGSHSLYMSIFDQGDHVLDSAVMLDNLRLGHVANVATDCKPGATVAPPAPGVTVHTSVSNFPFKPDPGPNGSVQLHLKATNSDGSPAANALVKMSNSKPGAVFHTDSKGSLVLEEPVSVGDNGASSVTASVTATTGAKATATQLLYQVHPQAECSFDGKPAFDISVLTGQLPDLIGRIPVAPIQTLIEAFGPALSGVHTNAMGYVINVPGSSNLYAQSVTITRRSNGAVLLNQTAYSTHQILVPPKGQLDAIQAGCRAIGNLA